VALMAEPEAQWSPRAAEAFWMFVRVPVDFVERSVSQLPISSGEGDPGSRGRSRLPAETFLSRGVLVLAPSPRHDAMVVSQHVRLFGILRRRIAACPSRASGMIGPTLSTFHLKEPPWACQPRA
jgi:hypothetical protein